MKVLLENVKQIHNGAAGKDEIGKEEYYLEVCDVNDEFCELNIADGSCRLLVPRDELFRAAASMVSTISEEEVLH